MTSALKALEKIGQEDLPRARAESPKEFLEKMEVENALLVAEMILRSALMREESRGAHFRRDFPQPNDSKWKGNIFLKKSSGGMQLTFQPLREKIS